MRRNMIQTMKQDVCSFYFGAAVLLVLGVCLLSPGIGMLDMNGISRPMLIEELFGHTKPEFQSFSDVYNYEEMFYTGISGFLYMVLPLAAMASVNRYCEEKVSGFWVHKTVKTGRLAGTVGNLMAASLVSCLAVFIGLSFFIALLVLRLPYQKFEAGFFLRQSFFVCIIAVLGMLLSVMTAALTANRFYAFVIPAMLFYVENEFMIGGGESFFRNFLFVD